MDEAEAPVESTAPKPVSQKRRKKSGVSVKGKMSSLSRLPGLSIDVLFEVTLMFLISFASQEADEHLPDILSPPAAGPPPRRSHIQVLPQAAPESERVDRLDRLARARISELPRTSRRGFGALLGEPGLRRDDLRAVRR